MSSKGSKDYIKDYTKPELRKELKEKIKSGDKGGRKGQWSARKSQLLKKAYEENGGGYVHPEKLTQEQKNLKQWTQEEWKTNNGTKAINGSDTKRYLPSKVWENLSDDEKVKAEETKLKGTREGKQKVPNTENTKNIKRIIK